MSNIFVCHVCGSTSDKWDRCCDRNRTLHIKEEYLKKQDLRPMQMRGYWSENLERKPVWIENFQHLETILKEKKLYIPPYKKNEYEGYRPVVNGHKMSEHEYQLAQKKGFWDKPKVSPFRKKELVTR